MESVVQFRSKNKSDDAWITGVANQLWSGVDVISKEGVYNILELSNVIAEYDGKPVGFAAYSKEGNKCEIVALYSAVEKQGIATALIDRVKELAKKEGCTNVWLMTTNDNIHALRFYQKRGFVITGIRINEMERQRKLKPQIPLLGNDGIPLRDERELEISL